MAKEADEVEQCGEVSPHNSSEYPELGQLATADSLVYRPPSRVSRLEKSKHLDIDEEILRGADLHRTLRHFGKVWQKPPSHLNHRDRTALWSYSTPVRGFDTFLSHTWLTPGRWKVLALTLQGGWPVMLMCWAIVTALTTALYAFGIISMPYTITAHYEDFQKVCPLGPWLVLSGFPALMLGMVVSPYVPIAQQIAFVDMFSIHQTDPELMERGIYGIGGCLRRSQQLKVLWSPPYLPQPQHDIIRSPKAPNTTQTWQKTAFKSLLQKASAYYADMAAPFPFKFAHSLYSVFLPSHKFKLRFIPLVIAERARMQSRCVRVVVFKLRALVGPLLASNRTSKYAPVGVENKNKNTRHSSGLGCGAFSKSLHSAKSTSSGTYNGFPSSESGLS